MPKVRRRVERVKEMVDWYGKASLEQGHRPEVVEALERNEDPIKFRVKFKFTEAETYRPSLKSLTAGRLAALLSIRELNDYPEIAPFRDPNPGQILWLTLMLDFYNDRPTDRTLVLADMGSSYRTSEMLIRESVAGGGVVTESDPADRRRSLLFPSIMTVLTYEFVLMPKYLEAVDKAMGDSGGLVTNRKELLAKIYDYYNARAKHSPELLNIEIAARQARVKLELVPNMVT
jgi:hypothetical protein